MKTQPIYRKKSSPYIRFNPLASLTPEKLARQLEAFYTGELREIARTWETIECRDDTVQSVSYKRKIAAARYGWDVFPDDDSDLAKKHTEALKGFYTKIEVVNAHDENERGGFQLLARQMMDAVGKRYAVHELV
jgi:phage gp29-like protein